MNAQGDPSQYPSSGAPNAPWYGPGAATPAPPNAGGTPPPGPDHTAPGAPSSPKPRGRRRWVWPAAVVLAFVFGTVVGGAGGGDPTASAEYTELAGEVDGVRDELGDVQGELDAANARADGAEGRIEGAEAEADARVAEADTRLTELDTRAAELDTREATLVERETAVIATEEHIVATQISNGIWTVGVDIEPGTYRTVEAVTSMCYWAILVSGTNGSDIVDNDLPDGGYPTVTLREGQDFENDCGVWNQQ